jgi:putative ABC transport system permease protein
MKESLRRLRSSFAVGSFLGWRMLRRANKWTAILTVAVMALTFVNLVAVSGILVGLIEGSVTANRDQYTADIFISELPGESRIENSARVIATVSQMPGLASYSARTMAGGTLEANYRERSDPTIDRDTVGASLVGIDPEAEDRVTNLSKYVAEGRYLLPDEEGAVLIGANLLDRYSAGFGDGFSSLEDVYPGDKLLLTVNAETGEMSITGPKESESGDDAREVTVAGIIDSKVDATSIRVFMNEREVRAMAGLTSGDVNEVSVRLRPGASAEAAKAYLVGAGLGDIAKVRTFRESIPEFLEQIQATFGLLGNLIGAVGLAVASITIFIVVFVSAVTRRKQVGIMKAIGVAPRSIIVAYVSQAMAYSVIGVGLAALLIFLVLVPFIDAHPIDFPFSDGILVATPGGTALRAGLLLLATVAAGIIPAWLIVRQNTLDVILGRK